MKWIGQHIWSLISRFRSDVYLEDLSTSTETNILVVDSGGKITKNKIPRYIFSDEEGDYFVKILPSDFESSSTSMRYAGGLVDSKDDSILYAFVPIPAGTTATSLHIYGNDTSGVTVSEGAINASSLTSKGTGAVGSDIDFTNVAASNTNIIVVIIDQANDDDTRIYGGIMYLEVD